MALSSLTSMGREMSSMISRASLRARLKAEMMTTGWMLRSSCGRAWARISPAVRCQYTSISSLRPRTYLTSRRFQPTQNDHRRCAIANLLVLCPAQLDHAFSCWVRHLNLAQDGVAVVGQDDAAHGVEEHLEHRLGSEARPDNVRNAVAYCQPESHHHTQCPTNIKGEKGVASRLGGSDVRQLGFAPSLSFTASGVWAVKRWLA